MKGQPHIHLYTRPDISGDEKKTLRGLQAHTLPTDIFYLKCETQIPTM